MGGAATWAAAPGVPVTGAAMPGGAVVVGRAVVIVPHDIGPGDKMQVVSPQGQAMEVQVPAGVGPGGQFQVQF